MFAAVLQALVETEPSRKCQLVAALEFDANAAANPAQPSSSTASGIPGRPPLPLLLHPREVPARGLGSLAGRAALAHAVAHIEFNAINLALDAAWRFRGLPADYYADWISVAQDEARHFAMLRLRLQQLGYDYGSFNAHNGLWEAAEKTAHDALTRMACVPRVLEARGLDVTPGIIKRLREVGDLETLAVLEVILAEEVRHVAIGTRWFHYLCGQQGLAPVATFKRLLREQGMNLRPPFNLAARAEAGFVDEEFL